MTKIAVTEKGRPLLTLHRSLRCYYRSQSIVTDILEIADDMQSNNVEFSLGSDKIGTLTLLMKEYADHGGMHLRADSICKMAIEQMFLTNWIELINPDAIQAWVDGKHIKDIDLPVGMWNPNKDSIFGNLHQPEEQDERLEIIKFATGDVLQIWDWWADEWHLTRDFRR